MDQGLINEILTSDSDEIADLKANISILEQFIDLARKIDSLPDTSKRFYEESRSLFQTTSIERSIEELESLLHQFFGPPVKPAGKPLPRKLRKSSSVKYLGGIEIEQSLFLLNLKTGEFYGALWPWRRNKNKIEIHLGYCSDWITDQDYQQIEQLVKRSLSQSAFRQMETAVGGLIHGISLPSFLQMAEMERANFTLRITAGERSGYLYLKDGVLIAAQLEERKGHEAAYRIISWDGISIEILPAEESRTVEIKQPLMHVLMESLKIKDEITSSIEGAPDGEAPRPKKHSKYSQRLVRLERAPSPRAPSKKVRPLAVLIAVISIVTICGVGLLAYLHFEDRQKSADGYQDLLRQIERIEGAELKMIHLQEYLAANAKTPNRRLIEAQIAKLRLEAEDQDFEKTTLQISSHEVNELYEQRAISMYSTFLEKYPNSRYTERINKAISDIKELLDQYYYEELKRAAQLDFKARLKTYREYVARFPTGRFRNDVETLIIEMGRQYLSYLKTEMEHCQKNQRWDNCISRSEGFADAYTGTPLESEANKFKAEVSDRRDLGQLRKTVELLGTDYQKAYETYKAYLTEHPQSTQKTILLEEMGQLDKKAVSQRKWLAVLSFASETNNGLPERIQRVDAYLRNNSGSPYISEAQDIMTRLEAERRASLRQRQTETKKQEEIARLQKEKAQQEQRQKLVQKLRMDMERQLSGSSRYRSNGDGTVTDLKTNLTWGLLDANQELGGCLNYPNAHNYVRGLSLGGYTDWRMPTANELAAIYKQTPYFPTSGTEWYWSSESYAKGYHTVADIVTSEPKSVFERAHRELNQCGGVRAVRP